MFSVPPASAGDPVAFSPPAASVAPSFAAAPPVGLEPPPHRGRWLVLELVAGSAGLSKLSVASGFSPVVVDGPSNRFAQQFDILEIDVLAEHGRGLIRNIAVDPRPRVGTRGASLRHSV